MGIIFQSVSKGITRAELPRLRSAFMGGHNAEKLSQHQVDSLMDMVEMAMDADSAAERAHGVGQVDANEEKTIENLFANKGIPSTPAQRAFVHRILMDFVNNSKGGTMSWL